MPAFRDIVRRIDSIKNTQKITKAMQVVAATRLRRAQAAVQATRPYSEKMLEVLQTAGERTTGPAVDRADPLRRRGCPRGIHERQRRRRPAVLREMGFDAEARAGGPGPHPG